MTPGAAWIYAAMCALSAPRGLDYRGIRPEARETQDEQIGRWQAIASDLAEVVRDEEPLYEGPYGRARTAAVLLGVSYAESGWHRHVDFGLGAGSRGDTGRSWCLMQIQLGERGVTAEGYTGPGLVADRRRCFRAGLRIVRLSFRVCGSDRLNVYASGSCTGGGRESAVRMGLAQLAYRRARPPVPDELLFAALGEHDHDEAP